MDGPFASHLGSNLLSQEPEGPAEHEPPATGDSATATQDKPIRLALACNQCRKRKVRCDAQHPKCRNCSVRGDVCETSDPRKPGNFPAVRRRATRCCPKARGRIEKTPSQSQSPARRSISVSTLGPAALNSINSVLNPTGPSPDGPEQTSPNARRSSRSSAVAGSSASPATPSWRTTQSDRLGEDHFSWQSRAYQEEAQDQEVVREGGTTEPARVVTPEEDVNTDDTTNDRAKHLGASSVQCLFNFIDLRLERHGFSHVTPLFKHGMLHTEEFPMPLIPRLPMLPHRHQLSAYFDVFFSRLWPLYPIIDRSAIEADLDTILGLQEAGPEAWQQKATLTHTPALVSVYAVVSLGMNEVSGNSQSSFDYLMASHSFHGQLTAIPYMPSVQALFLLALALRAIAKDGQAWHIIGHAIRIAQSIGLHKFTTKDSSGEGFTLGLHPETLRERLWWSLFGLEKLMQLECGRASILDKSYDSLAVHYPTSTEPNYSVPYFRAWIALASIMGRISTRLYSHRFMGGSAEMLGVVSQLDQELLEWESLLPDTLKPGKALTDHTVHEHQILATFLSQQYYHAQLTILRVSVIFPQSSIKTEVQRHLTTQTLPPSTRLLDGAQICATAARSIITTTLLLADAGLKSTLLSVGPTYLAAVILALGVLRQPSSRLVRADIELLSSATEYVEGWFLGSGFGAAFTETCALLRGRVGEVFRRGGGPGALSGDSGHAYGGANANARLAAQSHGAGSSGEQQASLVGGTGVNLTGAAMSNPHGVDQQQHGGEGFGGFEFEDLWTLTGLDFMVSDEGNPLFAS